MQGSYEKAIFFIDVEKILPNPFQPRREFEEGPLRDLADSIRQYGVLQPLVVSRTEKETPEGGLTTEYELIAGERRLRASKLAGLPQVPVIIRTGDDSMAKLELAIIENLQREDLNAVDRSRAFLRLQDEFKFTHGQIGQKVGKSREYVSNTMRLLALPQEILDALSQGKISEGHTRPLLMLSDKPEEQMVLFKEIVYKKMTVREAERAARRVAVNKIRNKEYLPDPEISEIETKLEEALGTRVHIERKENGGHITIDFFTNDDLRTILGMIHAEEIKDKNAMLEKFIAAGKEIPPEIKLQETPTPESESIETPLTDALAAESIELVDDRGTTEKTEDDADLYSIKNFSI